MPGGEEGAADSAPGTALPRAPRGAREPPAPPHGHRGLPGALAALGGLPRCSPQQAGQGGRGAAARPRPAAARAALVIQKGGKNVLRELQEPAQPGAFYRDVFPMAAPTAVGSLRTREAPTAPPKSRPRCAGHAPAADPNPTGMGIAGHFPSASSRDLLALGQTSRPPWGGFSSRILSLLGPRDPFLRHDPERNPQRWDGVVSASPAAPRVPLHSRSMGLTLPTCQGTGQNPDQPHPGKMPLRVSGPERSRRGGIPRGPSPRRPGSGCSAGAPAASRRTAGRAAGRWAASGTGCRSPALQGKAGRATRRAEHTPRPRAPSAAVTRELVLPVPGALPGSPRPFRSSSHWLTCGNRRISLHFLLLPFRLPPPPAARGEGEEEVTPAGRAVPATGGTGWQNPCPVLQSCPVWGFPSIPPLLVPKIHRSHVYPHTTSAGAFGNSWENTLSALERALTPEGTLAPNS